MLELKCMKVAACLATPRSLEDPWDTVSQWKGITPEDSGYATKIYKTVLSIKQTLARSWEIEQMGEDVAENYLTERMLLSEKHNNWRPDFIIMLQNYLPVWKNHLGKTTRAKHRFASSPTDAPPIHLSPYFEEPKQREPEPEEVAEMEQFERRRACMSPSYCVCAEKVQKHSICVENPWLIPLQYEIAYLYFLSVWFVICVEKQSCSLPWMPV